MIAETRKIVAIYFRVGFSRVFATVLEVRCLGKRRPGGFRWGFRHRNFDLRGGVTATDFSRLTLGELCSFPRIDTPGSAVVGVETVQRCIRLSEDRAADPRQTKICCLSAKGTPSKIKLTFLRRSAVDSLQKDCRN